MPTTTRDPIERLSRSELDRAAHSVVWWTRNTDMDLEAALDYVWGKTKMTHAQADKVRESAKIKLVDSIGIYDTVLVRLKSADRSKLVTKKDRRTLVSRAGLLSQRDLWNIYNQKTEVEA